MLGRRGAVLALLGFIYALVGFAYLTVPLAPSQRESWRVLLAVAPQPAWGTVWLTVGVVAVVTAAFARRYAAADTFGYGCLAGISTAWCAGYGAAAVAFGVERAWLGVAVWSAMVAMLLIVAGWPEPGKAER